MRKVILFLLVLITVATASATDVTYATFGSVNPLDTAYRTNSYNLMYKSCDSSVIVIEAKDTLTVESVVVEIMSMNGVKVKSDTLLSATTINGGVKAIAFKPLPYSKLYTMFKLIIRAKGKTFRKAQINSYIVYIKED